MDTNYHRFKIIQTTNSQKVDYDGVEIMSATDGTLTSGYLGLGAREQPAGTQGYYNWVFVREYASTEPSASAATEEKITTDGVGGSGTWTSPVFNYWDSGSYQTIEDFEDNNTTNWTATTSTIAIESTTVDSGTYSAKWTLTGTAGTPNIELDVATQASALTDSTYNNQVVFRFRTTDNTNDHYFQLEDGSSNTHAVEFKSQLTNDTYSTVTLTLADFTTGGVDVTDIAKIKIYVTGSDWVGTEAFYLDRIRWKTNYTSSWRAVTWSNTGSGTVTLDIQDSGGTDISGFTGLSSGASLATLPTGKKKFILNLSSSGSTPVVNDFDVFWKPCQVGDFSDDWSTDYST